MLISYSLHVNPLSFVSMLLILSIKVGEHISTFKTIAFIAHGKIIFTPLLLKINISNQSYEVGSPKIFKNV